MLNTFIFVHAAVHHDMLIRSVRSAPAGGVLGAVQALCRDTMVSGSASYETSYIYEAAL